MPCLSEEEDQGEPAAGGNVIVSELMLMRRSQCDLQVPECGQCIKSNRACTGYHREAIFKHSSLVDRTAKASDTLVSPCRGASKELVVHGNKSLTVVPSQKLSKGSISIGLARPIHPRNVYRTQALSAFIDSFIPEAEKLNGVGHRRPITWLQIVGDLPDHSEALPSALAALSYVRIARLHQDFPLLKEAQSLYGTALAQLQRVLSDKRLVFRDDTLAACMALEKYEV